MLLVRKRARGMVLELPQDDGHLPVANPQVFMKYGSSVMELASAAQGFAIRTTGPALGLQLAEEFTERWWPGSEPHEQLLDIVSDAVRLGYAFAMIEISQALCVDGTVHPIVATAIDWASIHIARAAMLPGDSAVFHLAYAVRAGYYAGRVGDSALAPLVAAARPIT